MKRTRTTPVNSEPIDVDSEPVEIQFTVPAEGPEPSFFWLIACTIIIGDPKEPGIQTTRLINLLMDTPAPIIPKSALAQIQQLTVNAAMERMGIESSRIGDLAITGIMPLGQMTHAQFMDTPTGTAPKP